MEVVLFMAKDPAVLFYTSDFLTGTILMTYEQRGKYITLLCIQHQKGLLSEKDMLNICQSYDKDIYDKFIKTDDGYYNQRMKEEHEKRSNFSKSRSENRIKGIENQKNKSKKNNKSSYDNHMENVNENILPTIQEFLEYCKTIKEFDFKEYEYSYKNKYETWVADGWRDGNGAKIKNWKSKIKNTIPYLKPIKQSNKGSQIPNAIG